MRQHLNKSKIHRRKDRHLALYNFACLCMTLYDFVWLCMTMYDYVWLYMTMYNYIWLCKCMALYYYVSICMTVYDCMGLCMTMYDYIWLCIDSIQIITQGLSDQIPKNFFWHIVMFLDCQENLLKYFTPVISTQFSMWFGADTAYITKF